MDMKKLQSLAITLAACYAVYRYAGPNWAKGMALGVAGTAIAKQIPYVGDAA